MAILVNVRECQEFFSEVRKFCKISVRKYYCSWVILAIFVSYNSWLKDTKISEEKTVLKSTSRAILGNVRGKMAIVGNVRESQEVSGNIRNIFFLRSGNIFVVGSYLQFLFLVIVGTKISEEKTVIKSLQLFLKIHISS